MSEIIVGVLSGFIASGIFLLFLRSLRPNIHISPEIAVNNNKYTIKIINKSQRNAVDIRVELLLVQSKNVPGGSIISTNTIQLNKDKAFILAGYDSNDTDAKYARRFNTDEDLHGMWNNKDIQYLIFRIYCHDEVSGFGKVFSSEYRTKRNSLISGQFHFGNDLSIS